MARICVVRQDFYPLDVRIWREVEALAGAGHHVDVVCQRLPGEAVRERQGRVTVWRLPVPHRRGGLLLHLVQYVAFLVVAGSVVSALHLRRRYQLVQVNSMPDTLVFAALLPRLLGVPVLLDLHECMPEFFATRLGSGVHHPAVRVVARLEQVSIRFSRFAITCTEDMRRAFVARGAPVDKIVVVHNGADEEVFDAGRHPPRARDTERFVLISHGTIEERYGLDTIVRAVALLHQDIPGLRLEIYGTGSYVDELRRLAKDLGVEAHVSFAGGFVPFDDLVQAIADADVGVVAMKRDIFRDLTHCNKMYEFITMRKPTIVSRTGSVEAYYSDGCFEMFDSDDENDLAGAIRRLHADPGLAARRVERAAAVNEPYRWPNQRQVYLSVVDGLLRPARASRRRWSTALLVTVLAACSALSVGSGPSRAGGATTDPRDEPGIVDRVRAELAVFTNWLAAHNVDGYIGEVGWPDDGSSRAVRWNEVGEAWYRDADAARLWVSQWATGEWWPPDYALAVYFRPSEGSSLRAKAQAGVIEAHPSTDRYHRGMNVNGGEFGAVASTTEKSSFSNRNPGKYDREWHYDGQETFDYLAARGHRHARLLFRWERVQPTLGGPLHVDEVQRLKDVVARAHSAGIAVIPTVGNFGAYMLHDAELDQGVRRAIGSRHVTARHFYDLWRRLSLEFQGNPGILAYGLMNEPVFLPGANARDQARGWEQVSQGALDAIRENGDRTLVMVPGYYWSHVHKWAELHPEAWITDPANHFRYEAHHYFGEYG